MDIEALKIMAMADGVLTEHEKEVFKKNTNLSDTDLKILFNEIESELESVQSETEIIDWKRKNGLDFEKYIVTMVKNNSYVIDSWTGDKFVDGKYDSKNLDPDIRVRIKLEKQDICFAIECKWRFSFYKGAVFVASDKQLRHYKEYQEKNNVNVSVAIGIGGTGKNPDEIFIIPIDYLKYPIAKEEYVRKFKKKKEFIYFDIKKNRII